MYSSRPDAGTRRTFEARPRALGGLTRLGLSLSRSAVDWVLISYLVALDSTSLLTRDFTWLILHTRRCAARRVSSRCALYCSHSLLSYSFYILILILSRSRSSLTWRVSVSSQFSVSHCQSPSSSQSSLLYICARLSTETCCALSQTVALFWVRGRLVASGHLSRERVARCSVRAPVGGR